MHDAGKMLNKAAAHRHCCVFASHQQQHAHVPADKHSWDLCQLFQDSGGWAACIKIPAQHYIELHTLVPPSGSPRRTLCSPQVFVPVYQLPHHASLLCVASRSRCCSLLSCLSVLVPSSPCLASSRTAAVRMKKPSNCRVTCNQRCLASLTSSDTSKWFLPLKLLFIGFSLNSAARPGLVQRSRCIGRATGILSYTLIENEYLQNTSSLNVSQF